MVSAVEKYNQDYDEVVKVLDKKFSDLKVGDKMLISSPRSIAAHIRNIPFGSEKTLNDMRIDLAEQSGADNTCPLTTGIFLRIAVEAHMEDPKAVEEMPYWCVIDERHALITKLNIPPAFVIEKRRSEGLV